MREILNKLEEITEAKNFRDNVIMDHSSIHEIESVYWAAGLSKEDFQDKDGNDLKEFEDLDKTYSLPIEGEVWEEALSAYIEEAWYDFEADFRRRAAMENGKLLIYRCITVENSDELISHIKKGKPLPGYEGIGIYWAWDKDAADCHNAGSGNAVILAGAVNPNDIDYERTAALNLNPALGKDEKEIRLKEGAKVTVLSILDEAGEGTIWEGESKIAAECDTLLKALAYTLEKRHKITSGISPVLYHYTGITNAINILEEDKFKLTTLIGTESEENLRKKSDDAFYYLSTTRHKLGGYHLNKEGILFVLDGRKLSYKYSGDPIDYWGESFRKANPKKFEAEDRVWSKDPYIEPASKYITEIHYADPYVMSNSDVRQQDRYKRWLRKLMLISKKKKIPLYVYTDPSDFKSLDKRKAKSLDELDLVTKEEPDIPWRSHRRNPLSEWFELYYKNDKKHLSKRAKDYLNSYLGLWNRDGIRQLKNTIHNNKSRPEIIEPLVKILRKEKLTTIDQFFNFLVEKWSE